MSWESMYFSSSSPLCYLNEVLPSTIHSLATECLFVCPFFPVYLCLSTCAGFPPFPSAAQPSVLLRDDPPPYSPLTSPESGSAPVITCRVCQNAISVEGKIHQHVVKCAICNEATVGCAKQTSRVLSYSNGATRPQVG